MDSSSFQSVCELLKEKHDRPGAIKRACGVVEDCLITNKDNLRGFFEYCFPLLLKKIFGYDDRDPSWLFTVASESRAEDLNAIIQLLAPTGTLFSALHSADAEQIIQFLFPPERLPAHTQELLRLPAGRLELSGWPQYMGRLKMDGMGRCQVHLNMYQYFMFWAAFYVLRGARAADKGKAAASSRGRAFIQSGRRFLGGGNNGGSSSSSGFVSEPAITPRNPYFKLLRLYFEAYLPRPKGQQRVTGGGAGAGTSAGGASAAAAAAGAFGAVLGGSMSALAGANTAYAAALSATPGEMLLSVLLEFWLTDAGEPLPQELTQQAAAAAAAAAGAMPGSSPQGGPLQQGLGPGISSRQVSGNMAAQVAAATRGWGGGGVPGMAGMGAADAMLGNAAMTAPGVLGVPGVGAGMAVDPMQAAYLSGAVSPAAAAAAGGVYGGQAGGLGLWSGTGAVGLGGAGGNASSLQVYSYQPPSEDLLMALTLLVKYVFVVEPPRPDAPAAPAQGGSSWLPQSPVATLPLPAGRLSTQVPNHPLLSSPSFSPSVQAVSRKLYRLLRRTFAQWQPSSSASLSKVIGLWLVVLAPWRAASYSDTQALQQTLDSIKAAADSRAQRISAGGSMGGVAAGAHGGAGAGTGIFTGSMFGSKLTRLGSEMVQAAHHLSHVGQQHGEGQEQRGGGGQPASYTRAWRAHVWAHLPFYTVLLPAFLQLCHSQTAYNARNALNNVYRVLKVFIESGPELLQEIRQAEEAYTQYLSSNKMRRSDGDLADLLPWLAEQAQDWENIAAAGAPAQPPLLPDPRYRMFDLEHDGAPRCMQSLLAVADRLNIQGREKLEKAAREVLPIDQLPSEERPVAAAYVGGRDLPKAGNWRGVSYQGDPMLRPITSYEIAWLVRLLVKLSQAFNSTLGLTATPQEPPQEPPETVVQEVLTWVRRHGWRLNLRFLAEKQTLAWLLGLALLTRFFWALFSSEGGAFSYEGYEEELQQRQQQQQQQQYQYQQQQQQQMGYRV